MPRRRKSNAKKVKSPINTTDKAETALMVKTTKTEVSSTSGTPAINNAQRDEDEEEWILIDQNV